jgi:hypothetical protein
MDSGDPLVLLLLAAALCPFTPNPKIGFYQWAAAEPAHVIERTAGKLHDLHAGLIRLYLGPRYDYAHPALDASRARHQPAEALRQYKSVLEDPCLPTVVLSAYPARDYGGGLDDISLNRRWSPADRQAETEQLLALAEVIYEIAGDQPKTVIIANSEADSRLVDIANYTGSVDMALQNISLWQRARYQAIARARLRHPHAKLRLLNAFEVSLINLGIERRNGRFQTVPGGGPNALRNIVPYVPFDLLSYSAYETTNSPYQDFAVNTPPADTRTRLFRDWPLLQRAAAGRPIVIGELGYSRRDFDALSTGGVVPRLQVALDTLRQLQPSYITLWQAFDGTLPDGAPDTFGLLEPGSAAEPLLRKAIAGR